MKYTCSMERVQQNGRFTLFSSKFHSNIYSILYGNPWTEIDYVIKTVFFFTLVFIIVYMLSNFFQIPNNLKELWASCRLCSTIDIDKLIFTNYNLQSSLICYKRNGQSNVLRL